jgi:hypothetical protein
MIIVYGFIIGIPTLLVLFAIKKIIRARRIAKHGIKTNAVITHIRMIRFSKSTSDKLTLEYTDNKGTRHSTKATTVPGHYKTGNTMPLKYLDNKPSAYAIDNTQQADWVLLVVCILLLAFTIFASYKIDELVQSSNFHFSP